MKLSTKALQPLRYLNGETYSSYSTYCIVQILPVVHNQSTNSVILRVRRAISEPVRRYSTAILSR